MLYHGNQTPEGVLFIKEEQGDGSQSVEALAVAHFTVVPAKCYQYLTKLMNLNEDIGEKRGWEGEGEG